MYYGVVLGNGCAMIGVTARLAWNFGIMCGT